MKNRGTQGGGGVATTVSTAPNLELGNAAHRSLYASCRNHVWKKGALPFSGASNDGSRSLYAYFGSPESRVDASLPLFMLASAVRTPFVWRWWRQPTNEQIVHRIGTLEDAVSCVNNDNRVHRGRRDKLSTHSHGQVCVFVF